MKKLLVCSIVAISAVFFLASKAGAQTASSDASATASPSNNSAPAVGNNDAGFQRVAPPPIGEMRAFSKGSNKSKTSKKKDEWMKEMPAEQQVFLQSQLRKTQETKADSKSKLRAPTKSTTTVKAMTKTGGATPGKKARKY